MGKGELKASFKGRRVRAGRVEEDVICIQ